jgi:hypothetical protein
VEIEDRPVLLLPQIVNESGLLRLQNHEKNAFVRHFMMNIDVRKAGRVNILVCGGQSKESNAQICFCLSGSAARIQNIEISARFIVFCSSQKPWKSMKRFPHFHRHDDNGEEWKSPQISRLRGTHSEDKVIQPASLQKNIFRDREHLQGGPVSKTIGGAGQVV